MTLRNRVLAAAHSHSTRLAIWADGDTLSYEALFSQADALAARLSEELPDGAALGLFLDRGIPAIVGILAAVLSSRPYLPLNPAFPGERLAAIINVARPGAILTDATTEGPAGALMSQLVEPVLLLRADGTPIMRNAKGAPDQAGTAYLMFTSGTTGVPKGVRVIDENVCAYLDGIAPITDLQPNDRATQFFDLSFDLSVHDVFVTLCAGASMHILPKTLSLAIVDFVNEQKITSWFSVPSLAAFCDRRGHLTAGALPRLRSALFCGEPLPVSLIKKFRSAAPNAACWNLYGPTEATIAITAYPVQDMSDLEGLSVVPLGHPLGDQKTRIDDTGELLLGGSQITPGYINAPDQNAQKFRMIDGTRFYRSGDIVTPSARFGALYKGRVDDQVKINGYRVELLEIDEVLRVAAGVPEVAAIPWPVSDTGQADQIIAFVCRPTVNPADIRKHCRRVLPSYMVPRKVIEVDQMPLSISGKIDRRRLVMDHLADLV
jgi:D-alanine--poly(phosphoribitol) ligase subunit 1